MLSSAASDGALNKTPMNTHIARTLGNPFTDLPLAPQPCGLTEPYRPAPTFFDAEYENDFLVQNHRPDLVHLETREHALAALDLP